MEQPDTTNPRVEPSLDDDVESLLASVKATQVEAPSQPDDGGADEDAAPAEIAHTLDPTMIASDDAASVADILNAQHDEAEAERESAANGDDALPGPAKINGDTAAIDAQLDELTRQAAALSAMAEEVPSVDAMDPIANINEASDVLEDLDAANATDALESSAASEPSDGAGDVASVMDAVAAEVAGERALPTTVENAAAQAAEMLAKATAAVEEVTGTSVAAPTSDAEDAVLNAPPSTGPSAADEALAEVAANLAGDTPESDAPAADAGEDPSASLDDLLANLETPPAEGADARAGESPRTQAQAPVAAAPLEADDASPIGSIQSLDEQIAQLSDDLLSQPSQVDAFLPPAQPVATPAPEAPANVAPTVASPAQAPEPVAVAAAPIATPQPAAASPVPAAIAAGPTTQPATQPAPPQASANQATAPQAVATEPTIAPSKPSVSLRQRLAPLFAGFAKVLGSLLGLATPALAAMSAPLAKKPRIIRDSVGWIAVNTVFCASCLWGYMLFLRPAQIAEQHAAFDLAHAELPEVPAGSAHGENAAAESHGTEGGAEHGAPKEEGHGAKKEASHGGAGGHGDAKAGPKKEAYKPASRKPPTKAEREKAKPKEAGHGGGGGGGH